ncbi:MAG: heavy-metal-associated domain-containing protein [Chloroflexi bacterium]|nr:heavy-metal-associated domain-containing protein [Chloroflexota bacterium]
MTPRPTVAGALPAGHPSLVSIRFPVAGMTCAACVGTITRALRRLDGVDGVRVDLRGETVTVRRVASSVPEAAIAAAIADAGYTADLAAAVTVAETALDGPLLGALRRVGLR